MNVLIEIYSLIVVFSITLLPYMLTAGLFRAFLPQVRVWWLSLLSVMVMLIVCTIFLPLSANIVRFDRVVVDTLSGLTSFQRGYGQGLGCIAKWTVLSIMFTSRFVGSILIPLLIARAGVAIVDRIRRSKRSNDTDNTPA
jgi:hypothetical protein